VSRILVVAVLAALALAAPARSAQTIVSIQFDDGRGQAPVRAILARHHVHATFFINTGYTGTPDYFTWAQLHALAADGNEIAGHTLTHCDLPSLSAAEQMREICGDRAALIAHGFKPVDFAYPFGSYAKATERIVERCGYSYGRAAWGLWGSGCEEEPSTCPYAVDTAKLGDPWAIPTADAPIDLTYVENQRQVVLNAIAHGGGWVQFFFHRICPDDCDEYSWTPASLDAFLTWLDQQRSAGALVVRASYRSLDGPRFVVWARSKAGGWSFWRQGPRLAPAGAFRRASWALPAVPSGVTALSVGVSLGGDGRLAADDLALVGGS